MYQVQWQEDKDFHQLNGDQYESLEEAIESYEDKVERGFYWTKLSHDLKEHLNK